jgi:hypothetical protein
MDTQTIRLWIDALKAHLMSIVEADHLYQSEKEHSHEEETEYQKRQERLNEIRWELVTLTPSTIQSSTIQ